MEQYQRTRDGGWQVRQKGEKEWRPSPYGPDGPTQADRWKQQLAQPSAIEKPTALMQQLEAANPTPPTSPYTGKPVEDTLPKALTDVIPELPVMLASGAAGLTKPAALLKSTRGIDKFAEDLAKYEEAKYKSQQRKPPPWMATAGARGIAAAAPWLGAYKGLGALGGGVAQVAPKTASTIATTWPLSLPVGIGRVVAANTAAAGEFRDPRKAPLWESGLDVGVGALTRPTIANIMATKPLPEVAQRVVDRFKRKPKVEPSVEGAELGAELAEPGYVTPIKYQGTPMQEAFEKSTEIFLQERKGAKAPTTPTPDSPAVDTATPPPPEPAAQAVRHRPGYGAIDEGIAAATEGAARLQRGAPAWSVPRPATTRPAHISPPRPAVPNMPADATKLNALDNAMNALPPQRFNELYRGHDQATIERINSIVRALEGQR